MKDGRAHSFVNLALSLVIFAISVGAAVLGTDQHDLFADPGRPDATAPLEAAIGR